MTYDAPALGYQRGGRRGGGEKERGGHSSRTQQMQRAQRAQRAQKAQRAWARAVPRKPWSSSSMPGWKMSVRLSHCTRAVNLSPRCRLLFTVASEVWSVLYSSCEPRPRTKFSQPRGARARGGGRGAAPPRCLRQASGRPKRRRAPRAGRRRAPRPPSSRPAPRPRARQAPARPARRPAPRGPGGRRGPVREGSICARTL
jgi:hypothetical protein